MEYFGLFLYKLFLDIFWIIFGHILYLFWHIFWICQFSDIFLGLAHFWIYFWIHFGRNGIILVYYFGIDIGLVFCIYFICILLHILPFFDFILSDMDFIFLYSFFIILIFIPSRYHIYFYN